MSAFGWVLFSAGASLLPIISVTYCCLRLPDRRERLKDLFKREGILLRYLVIRGQRPERQKSESADVYLKRLQGEFDSLFSKELAQEYSASRYAVPMVMAWIATAIAVFFLVAAAFGASLHPGTPSAVLYAVLGAYFWSVWSTIRSYVRTDLVPAAFFWIPFRYILAIPYGLLAREIFAAPFADLGAFVVTTLPFAESIKFIRSRLASEAKWWTPIEGHPKLSEIQGMAPSTIEKLEDFGIHTTQELAFSDPLELLLRSNFSPKVLIDWLDQAFLYNYVGEQIAKLRPCGIRGAIEIASLQDRAEESGLIRSIAEALKTSEDDVRNLSRSLFLDNHLRLLWEIWGVFEEEVPEGNEQEMEARSSGSGNR